MSNLQEIAESVKRQHEAQPEIEETTQEEELAEFEEEGVVVEGYDDEENYSDDDDDDEPVIAVGVATANGPVIVKNDSITGVNNDGVQVDEDDEFVLTDEELKATMPDLDDEAFINSSEKIRNELNTYRKNLILNSGFTVEEATKAAYNRAKKLGQEENDAYLVDHPTLGIVEIDKKNVDKVDFTEDEREKLTKVRAIKLKVVEDVELSSLSIERVDVKHKASVLQSLDTNLSQYSVPLPLMSDYCRFKGSQIIQLIQAVRYNDATLDEVIAKKASLAYNQLCNSANLQKFDDAGKTIMSYNDFINKFYFHDLDMAMYGILVASSMEEIESSLTCGECNTQFQWKYNLKALLSLDDISDDFKQKFDDILGHKSDTEYLKDLYDKNHKSVRVKSPVTQNVYELNYPTIARAINLYRIIDAQDETMLYLSAFALFISSLYVYNRKTEKYIPIAEDEYKNLLDVLQMIPQEEIDIIQDFLKPYLYEPKFILKSKCPACGHNMSNSLSIDDLVFLKARDSSTEIQQ